MPLSGRWAPRRRRVSLDAGPRGETAPGLLCEPPRAAPSSGRPPGLRGPRAAATTAGSSSAACLSAGFPCPVPSSSPFPESGSRGRGWASVFLELTSPYGLGSVLSNLADAHGVLCFAPPCVLALVAWSRRCLRPFLTGVRAPQRQRLCLSSFVAWRPAWHVSPSEGFGFTNWSLFLSLSL